MLRYLFDMYTGIGIRKLYTSVFNWPRYISQSGSIYTFPDNLKYTVSGKVYTIYTLPVLKPDWLIHWFNGIENGHLCVIWVMLYDIALLTSWLCHTDAKVSCPCVKDLLHPRPNYNDLDGVSHIVLHFSASNDTYSTNALIIPFTVLSIYLNSILHILF